MNAKTGLRWGLIGASNIAKNWLVKSIDNNADCTLGAVYSRSAERARDYAAAVGAPRSYSSLEAILADPDIDAVYISTTNEKHCEEAIAAARAGKHILCEKPLAISLAEARSMLDAAQAAGVVFATNHHFRNLGSHRKIREAMASGRLGRIVSARLSFTVQLADELKRWRLADPSMGAGVLLDLTVHSVDILRFYFGADPVAVTAMGLTSGDAPHGIEDNVVSVWEFPGKALASCHDTFLVPRGGTSLEVHGTEGSVLGFDVFERRAHRLVIRDGNGVEELQFPHVDPYEATIANFVAAVRGTGAPTATGEDGYRSLRLALAASESIATGRKIALR